MSYKRRLYRRDRRNVRSGSYADNTVFWGAVVVLLLVCSTVRSQVVNPETDNLIRIVPKEERFADLDALASPWSESGCHYNLYWRGDLFRPPNCYIATYPESDSRRDLRLFNEDGSLWYEFSLKWDNENPKNYKQYPKAGFSPIHESGEWGTLVILRIVGESDHWYKVQVDEINKSVKYIPKMNSNWVRTEWEYWILRRGGIRLGQSDLSLYDEPNGKFKLKASKDGFISFRYEKTQGDWILGQLYSGNGLSVVAGPRGWVQWRDGGRLLFDCCFD